MPLFPSDEWLDAFCARVQEHPHSGAMATALDGAYRFVIEPDTGLRTECVYEIDIAPHDGGARVAPRPTEASSPRLTISAAYSRWVQLVRGALDIRMAVLFRRVRLQGDVGSVMSNLDDARPLLDALSAVDSTFVNEESR